LRAFQQNNFNNELIVAVDGEQALQLLLPEDSAPILQPSVVLLDISLPKINGLEVLRRLRADPRTAALPVVVLTTSNEEADIISSYRLGANSFVRKPVVFSEFLAAASVLGMYWLLINQSAPDWVMGR